MSMSALRTKVNSLRKLQGQVCVSFRCLSVLIYVDCSSGPRKTRVRGASCREQWPRPSNGRLCRRVPRQSLKLAAGVDEGALPKDLSTGSERNVRELMPLWAHQHSFVSQVDSEKPHL